VERKSWAGWSKILGFYPEAKKHGCKYVWIDTYCINRKVFKRKGLGPNDGIYV
jgi:hypothetical protein